MQPIMVILALLLLAGQSKAQPEINWSQQFGDQGFDLHWHQAFVKDAETEDLIFIREHPSEDGLTRNYLTRVTSAGELVWSHLIPGGGRSFNIPALIKTSQGNYAMVGGSPIIGVDCEFLLLIMNEAGDLVSLTMFENGPASHGNCLIQTADGGFALSGYYGTQMEIRLDADFWLIRTDELGNVLWSQSYGTAEEDETCQALLETSDGGFMMAGNGGADILVNRVTGHGELIWSRTYGGNGRDECNALLATPFGDCLLVGSQQVEGNNVDGVVISIADTGDLRWEAMLGGDLPDRFGGALITSDGGLALFGTTMSGVDIEGDYWLVKLNALGVTSWECSFGGEAREEGNAIIQMNDGSFALAGNSCSNGAQFGDVWIVATTPDPDLGSSFTAYLEEGWNYISMPITPDDRDMEHVWNGLGNLDDLDIVKDQAGRFFIPARDYNGIPFWDECQGYLVKMRKADSLTFRNTPIEPNTPIPVNRGWNLVPYFPKEKLSAQTALAFLGERLLLAKDDQGRFFDPSANYSNMGLLRQGEGYAIRTSDPGSLIWNTGNREQSVVLEQDAPTPTTYFKPPKPDKYNMSLLIKNGSQETSFAEVAVIAESGRIVGTAVLNREGPTGLAVWGDNPETEEIEGAKEGERLRIAGWDGQSERNLQLNWISGDAVYSTDELHRVMISGADSSPIEFDLPTPYPNPFNGTLKISYRLSRAGLVRMTVSDVSGRAVATLVNVSETSGEHQVSWNAEAEPAGIYVIRIESGGRMQQVKAVLVK